MKGGQAKMAGVRIRNRILHRVTVANLPDCDDIRSFPHCVLQRVAIGECVDPDLALIHDRLLVVVHELDRVLDA
jgi:hypothetical protein